MIDRQDIFNKVWDRFIVKKAPLGKGEAECSYRCTDSLGRPRFNSKKRCAIGMFIPNHAYRKEWDDPAQWDTGIKPLYESSPEFKATIKSVFNQGRDLDADDLEFLDELQATHDRCPEHSLSIRRSCFEGFALRFNLVVPDAE